MVIMLVSVVEVRPVVVTVGEGFVVVRVGVTKPRRHITMAVVVMRVGMSV